MFDYFANREGVEWFVEKCWPQITRRIPEARLRLVGRGGDRVFARPARGVDGLGWVDDSAAEIATWSAMIIPLHKGGGTRVKIAESFSRKCPIVSTRIGAYGYDVADGKQLRLADSPEAFAEACIDLALKPSEAERMAERAWADFVEKWSWDAIAPRIWATAQDCLRRSAR
jgi:glycosyltransferase involved in cell wall biosynthesis